MARSTRLGVAHQALAGPIRYTFWRRYTDGRQGHIDGKKGLPLLDGPSYDTPMTELLHQTLLDQSAAELLQYEADITAPMADLKRMQRSIQTLTERIAELEQAWEGHRAVKVAPVRLAGEERVSDDVVAERRTNEHAEAGTPLLAELTAARAQLKSIWEQAVSLAESLAGQHRQLQARFDRLQAYHLERFAVYQRKLLRKHPDGPQLLNKLQLARPAIPASLRTPVTKDSLLGLDIPASIDIPDPTAEQNTGRQAA